MFSFNKHYSPFPLQMQDGIQQVVKRNPSFATASEKDNQNNKKGIFQVLRENVLLLFQT